MARMNVYIPDKLYQHAKRSRLNVSELTQRAIRDELLRRARLKALEEFTAALAARQGPATATEIAAADAWAAGVLAAAARAGEIQRKSRARKTRRSA